METRTKIALWLMDHPNETGLLLAACAALGAWNTFHSGRKFALARAMFAEAKSVELGG